MKKITGLSLFSGVDVARMAVAELGLEVDWYSSEIDKYAIRGAKALYDDTTYLGCVTKWREWDFDWPSVDIMTEGSPCQGFSAAGKKGGTRAVITGESGRPIEIVITSLIEYEFTRKLKLSGVDVQYLSCSYLFWEFVAIFEHVKKVNPNVKTMLENVAMTKNNMDMISKAVGVQPVMINSALLTAQNRKRNYWANWDISQPEDKGVLLKDIIEGGSVDREKPLCVTTRVAGATAKRYLEKSQHQMVIDDSEFVDRDNSHCIDANYHKGGNPKSYFKSSRRQLVFRDKETCDLLRSCELRETPPSSNSLCHHVTTATDINANEANKRVYADTGKSPTITTMGGGHRQPKILVGRIVGRKINPDTGKCDDYNPDLKTVQRLEARPDEKSGCITTVQKDNVLILDPPKYRKLTPRECMRLQGFTEEIIDKLLNAGISNNQLYKMTGNSFTLPVIIHNLQCLIDTGWMK